MRRRLNLVWGSVAAGLPVLALFLFNLRVSASSQEERSAAQQNLAIVVNLSNPVDSLSLDELRRIFLGERGHWANGRRITLVMMEPGRPERKAILRDVCQMNEADYSNRILHGLFTGELFVSPKTLASPTGVRKFVFNVPGAIGYVRLSEVDETVKVLRINGRLPEDKDYSLHIERAR
ncbi:MAG TPA: hypothetical protein VG498_20810 [Terriglobales bacterium]|nr:hypothetical protein [Terriglobales bacterium]